MKVFNTLSGRKEEFNITGNRIRMYVCGVTVYDYCHIGHARSQVVFDTIYRYLKWKGYEVTYVRNFTDVDDKIINRAREENLPWQDIAEKYIEAFYQDMEPLGIERPDIEPRATEHIPQMIQMIQALLDRGHAYISEGNVYFNVKSFPEYGKLSKRTLDEMIAGARVEPGEGKQNPLDFALWKASKPDEPSWDSPWGPGRPGWHIECSAMSTHYLGPSLDIHGGGLDLIFPHHENEIAQSEGATGVKPFVRYWIHNGFVRVNQEKMSKSLGNFFTIREILETHDPEALRLFLLGRHYRSPVDFTEKGLRDALAALERMYFSLYILLNRSSFKTIDKAPRFSSTMNADELPDEFSHLKNLITRFKAAMDDDFNTPQAIGAVFDALNQLNNFALKRTPHPAWEKALFLFISSLKHISAVLGVFGSDPVIFIEKLRDRHCQTHGLKREEIEKLVNQRADARKRKDYQQADAIRAELLKKNIILEDYPDGTQWRVRI